MNTRSLSFRLVAWYAGLLTLVFVVLGALTYLFLRHYLESNLLDTQARRAHQIADTLLVGEGSKGKATLASQVEDLYSPEANDRFIRITRSDGQVLYASGPPADGSFDPARVSPPPLAHARSFTRKEYAPGGTLLIAALPYLPANEPPYIVEVGISAARTDATLRQMLVMLAIGLPTAVVIAVAGGFSLVRRALRPVDELATKAEEITQHNLSERLPVMHTGDELERMSLSLNHMISRLEEALLSSKRFVADASHELRTPLTVLRGELEALAQDRELRGQTRETLGSMLEEVDRLTDLVEGLLSLSRLDAGEASAEWVRFDLADLAETTAEQMNLLAEDKHITVVCESGSGVFIEGDRARLKQVIVNLLDNAIKYSPDGAVVRLTTLRDGDFAVLEVADSGIGIPPEALPNVFKRFFRVDDSRSREQGGVGLGLSIVKAICSAHGADLEVVSNPSQGSRFRVRLPLASEIPEHATT